MASRVTVYGRSNDKNTERIRKNLDELSLNYRYFDIKKQPDVVSRIAATGEDTTQFPKVEVVCANRPGAVWVTNPDTETLQQTLYAEDVLGVTSFWI